MTTGWRTPQEPDGPRRRGRDARGRPGGPPAEGRPGAILLRGPAADLALVLAALALVAPIHAARAGWANAAALCLAGPFCGLAWARAVLPLALGGAKGEDG